MKAPAIAVVMLLLTTHAGADVSIAHEFAELLEGGRIGAFCAIAASPTILQTDAWREVRDLFDANTSIRVERIKAIDSDGPLVRVELDASGIARTEAHQKVAIPRVWWLSLDDDLRIRSAHTEAGRVARMLARASVAERDALLRDSMASEEEIARAVFLAPMRYDERARRKALGEWLRDRAHDRLDSRAELYAIATIARAARAGGDHEGALALVDGWLLNARQVAPLEVLACALLEAGAAAQGYDLERGAAYYAEAATLSDRLSDGSLASEVRIQQASFLLENFRFGEAVPAIERLSAKAERLQWPKALIAAAMLTAFKYRFLCRDELAAFHFLEAARRAQLTENAEAHATALLWVARCYGRLGRPFDEGMRILYEAMSIAPEDAFDVRAHLLADVANAQRWHRFEEAAVRTAEELKKIVAIAESADARRNGWAVLLIIHNVQGRYEEAVAAGYESLKANKGTILWLAWATKQDLAFALRHLGRNDEALAHLREAVELIEARWLLVPMTPADAARYFHDKVMAYAKLADLLAAMGDDREALHVLERGRTRVLSGLLQGRPSDATLARGEKERLHALESRIAALNRAVAGAGDRQERERTRASLAAARSELEDFRIRIAIAHPGAALRQALGAPPLDRTAAFPRAGTAVLEYAVLQDRIRIFAVTRTPSGDVRVRSQVVQIDEPTLNDLVAELSRKITARDMAYRGDARRLHALLIAPVERFVRGATEICIVPDAALWRVPFQVLENGAGTPVVAKYAVSYAPSISVLNLTATRDARSNPPRSILALGNPVMIDPAHPPLSDSQREVQEIGRFYRQSRIVTGAQATEAVIKQAGEHDILHFATHAVLDEGSSMYSALLLSAGEGDDGRLEAREVADLRLNARLAVLAACDTARGKVYAGEGTIGIAWAFLLAGCRTTVVSQWKTDSHATAELMVAFHRRLAAGASPAAALRQAQLQLRADPRHQDPLYWAAFVVIGAGR